MEYVKFMLRHIYIIRYSFSRKKSFDVNFS